MELMKAKLETMIGFSCCDVERGQKGDARRAC